jgi:hypothetical protein
VDIKKFAVITCWEIIKHKGVVHMTRSTDELKERLKKSCGWCGRYPACTPGFKGADAAGQEPTSAHESQTARSEAESRSKLGNGVAADPRASLKVA